MARPAPGSRSKTNPKGSSPRTGDTGRRTSPPNTPPRGGKSRKTDSSPHNTAGTRSERDKHQKKKPPESMFMLILLAVPRMIKKGVIAIGRGFYFVASSIADGVRSWDLSYFGEYGLIAVLGIAAVIIAVIGGLVWGFTNKNAYEVYLDDISVGIIRENPNITPESLTLTVKGAISNNTGTNVRPKGEITFLHIHASRGDFITEDAVINRLAAITEFEAELVSVTLEGNEVAVLGNMEEYSALIDRLCAPFRKEGMVIVEEGFVEDLSYAMKFADISEITPVNDAYAFLSAYYATDMIYTVKSGDTLGGIASRYSTTIEDLLERNGLTIEDATRLQPGHSIKIASTRPLLSIITVEEKKYKKAVPYDTIPQVNASRPAGYNEILVLGAEGEAEVTEHITYINGISQGGEIISEEVIKPPVSEIVEVGQG